MKTFDLEPCFDGAKSFYNKAKVIVKDGSIFLQSYSTIVAEITNGTLKIQGLYSQTTTRHIKEFVKQFHDVTIASTKDLRQYLGS
jgi:hypothetical protein